MFKCGQYCCRSVTITQAAPPAPINGACGSRAKVSPKYPLTQNFWPASDSWCIPVGSVPTHAVPAPIETAFPAPGMPSTSWSCSGLYGGSQSGNCTASRDYYVCTPPADPPHSYMCAGEDFHLTDPSKIIKNLIAGNCSNAAADGADCDFVCDNQTNKLCGSGTCYVYESGSCVPKTPNCCENITCKGQQCDNGCGLMVNGDKDCRDENWKEVTPE
jgi:hypothetical protein